MAKTDKLFSDILHHMELCEDLGVKSFDLYLEDMPFTIREEFISEHDLDKPQVPQPQLATQAAKLQELEQLVSNCQKCPLFFTRKNVVFGRGDAKACIMFVGGYPSELDEFHHVLYGGKDGEILSKIIKAMEVKVSEVFITTAVKCHPPGKSIPKEDEIIACSSYLRRQIEIINPAIIVTMGEVAYKALMKEDPKIFTQREHWESYMGIPLLSTFDLPQIIENPSIKKDVWRDMKSVLRKYHEILGKKES